VGALSVARDDLRAEEIVVRVYNLRSGSDAGNPGSVFLAARDGKGGGCQHCGGNGDDGWLGLDDAAFAGQRCGAGCDSSGIDCFAVMPVCCEHGDEAAERKPTATLRGLTADGSVGKLSKFEQRNLAFVREPLTNFTHLNAQAADP
jgi:hypothetical protein